jgi:hypothetical protein
MPTMQLDRRSFLNACTCAGITSALLPGVLYTLAVQAQDATGTDQSKPPKFTPEMIDQAAMLAGVGPFTEEQKKMMIDGLVDQNGSMKAIRKLKIPNSVAPAFVFHPLGAAKADATALPEKCVDSSIHLTNKTFGGLFRMSLASPARVEDVAFATVAELGKLLEWKKITSLALTQMYLERLKRYDPKLKFVITLTEERALAQAKAADAGHSADVCAV